MKNKIIFIGLLSGMIAGLLLFSRCGNSFPKRDLHACFVMVKPTAGFWTGGNAPDSAVIKTCERYHRQEVIFKLCAVTVDDKGNWKIGAKEKRCQVESIIKYIEKDPQY